MYCGLNLVPKWELYGPITYMLDAPCTLRVIPYLINQGSWGCGIRKTYDAHVNLVAFPLVRLFRPTA